MRRRPNAREFERAAELSRFFGGLPRAGRGARARCRSGYWTARATSAPRRRSKPAQRRGRRSGGADADARRRSRGVASRRARSSRGSTTRPRRISTTPARRCIRRRSSVADARGCTATRARQPALRQRPVAREHGSAIDTARALTLELFDADPAVYDVVFTANASGAIRILAEAFPFARRLALVLTADNHNSVNGLRVAARRRRAAVELRAARRRSARGRSGAALVARRRGRLALRVPGAVEFLRRHGIRSSGSGRAGGAGTACLLDAAALRRDEPAVAGRRAGGLRGASRSTSCSATRPASARWSRGATRSRCSGAATSAAAPCSSCRCQNRLARRKAGAAEAFEDGTPSFLAMPAVCDGLRWLSASGHATP